MRDKRLFVAIDIPAAVTERLVKLSPPLRGVRSLSADQIHLTISFLGNVGPIAEKTLREKLAAIRFTRSSCLSRALGCSRRRENRTLSGPV